MEIAGKDCKIFLSEPTEAAIVKTTLIIINKVAASAVNRESKFADPRADIIKSACHGVIDKLGTSNRLLEIALELEEIALRDDYFISRRLYPNVDFYSGLIYQAMGFPVEMFPVLFAIPRTVGWLAQWEEMLQDKEQKILVEKQEILEEQKKMSSVIIKQKEIVAIDLSRKTLKELIQLIGHPNLIREDRKTSTARFDSKNCRLFVFMDSTLKEPLVEYYELRNSLGELIDHEKKYRS